LEVQDLSTYFYTPEGVVKAVNGVSYTLEAGETLGLVGESGSGKSVSALSLLQLVGHPGRIVGGRALFQDQDLLSLSEVQMRRVRGRHIAIVFQEPMTSLNPVLSIERQITEAMELHMGLSRGQAKERAVELLDWVGIPEPRIRIKDYPHTFSGGMRQRVMIAMALSCEPSLIIADEPTTAVDVTIQAQLLELMKDLTTEKNASLIIISHNLGVVARYVDRVAIMYAGRIVEQGAVVDVFKESRHPYTLGLLRSIPRLDQPRREKLEPISGQPPDLANLPAGCAFRERCAYAVERCARDVPPLEEVGPGHWSACWESSTLAASTKG
jgi:oligopeptide/dipeptide ABC transporter ATP-binding protein